MMARHLRLLVPLCPLLLASHGCGVRYSDCPPAPLRLDDDRTCNFSDRCTYATPVDLGSTGTDYCNSPTCVCGKDGNLSCIHTLLECTPHVIRQCPAGTTTGAECILDPNRSLTNSECAVPGPGADLPSGIINGQVCACDNPGPVWRCLPVDKTSI